MCQQGEAIYVTTRDRIALRIDGEEIQRLPLAAESNHALASYVSPLVLDREVLVVAGIDHRLAASDTLESPQLWFSNPGAPFACSPLVVGDGVLGLRRDGTGIVIACDTGSQIGTIAIGEAVVAAWRGDGAIVGYTPTRRLRWDGETLELSEPLAETVIDAAPGLVVTAGRRIHLVAEDGTWTPHERYEANRKITASPVRWGDHVAITSANEVVVLGERGFSVRSEGDILRPTVVDGQLVVVEVSGKVRIYDP